MNRINSEMAEKLSGSLKALYQSIKEDDRIKSTSTQGVCDYKYFSPKRNSSISMKGKIIIEKIKDLEQQIKNLHLELETNNSTNRYNKNSYQYN